MKNTKKIEERDRLIEILKRFCIGYPNILSISTTNWARATHIYKKLIL
jgi:hypothetical protein